MSFGTWGKEQDILALVKEDLPGFVEFYFLLAGSDRKVGELWFREDFNDVSFGFSNKVIDINLKDNTLYTVVEDGKKAERFVVMSSYETYV